ncbi:unnamed protein product [Adineta ricciae]|uniref:Uncharacterized protein n=1 Tax=Adineta ricciae TaxID=249248 RepID=A0A814G7D0_ADIRI|nr:unnamed protein product [Adineta ricciae]
MCENSLRPPGHNCGGDSDLIKSYIGSDGIVRPEQLKLNPQITVKDLFQSYFQFFNNSTWLAQPSIYSISFNELHSLLYGSQTKNIYKSWPNYHKKEFDGSYPHTSMTTELFLIIAAKINISIHLVVEVGSFIGKSSSNIGRAIKIHPQWSKQVVLLCIDTWLGGVEHWLQYQHMVALEYGRPTIFEQFLANIIHANLTNIVLPLSTTSLIGAQLLIRHKLFPQVIYLDSAHLQGETLVEIEMFWALLQPGGILIGDDWRWRSVRCDVLRFARNIDVVPTIIRNTWFIQKHFIDPIPISTYVNPSCSPSRFKDLQEKLREEREINYNSLSWTNDVTETNQTTSKYDDFSLWFVNNSFFSTTLNRIIALFHLDDQCHLQIDGELQMKKRKFCKLSMWI